MARSKNGSGLATLPSSLKKRKSVWKEFVVLTISPHNDDVVISDIKARNTDEAYEIIEASSNNLESDILFSEKGFENLLEAIQRASGMALVNLGEFNDSRDIIREALADYKKWWGGDDESDKQMREHIDHAIEVMKNIQ